MRLAPLRPGRRKMDAQNKLLFARKLRNYRLAEAKVIVEAAASPARLNG